MNNNAGFQIAWNRAMRRAVSMTAALLLATLCALPPFQNFSRVSAVGNAAVKNWAESGIIGNLIVPAAYPIAICFAVSCTLPWAHSWFRRANLRTNQVLSLSVPYAFLTLFAAVVLFGASALGGIPSESLYTLISFWAWVFLTCLVPSLAAYLPYRNADKH